MHRACSPPATEESSGVRLRPQACFEANRRKAALRPRWRIETPQRPLGTFRRWKVPRRRLLQKRLWRRAGIRFAYFVRTVLCQSERDIFQNPLFQPHIFFSSRRKENVPLTVQKIGAAAPCIAQPPLAAALSAEQKGGRGSRRDMVRPPPEPTGRRGLRPLRCSSDSCLVTSLDTEEVKAKFENCIQQKEPFLVWKRFFHYLAYLNDIAPLGVLLLFTAGRDRCRRRACSAVRPASGACRPDG